MQLFPLYFILSQRFACLYFLITVYFGVGCGGCELIY